MWKHPHLQGNSSLACVTQVLVLSARHNPPSRNGTFRLRTGHENISIGLEGPARKGQLEKGQLEKGHTVKNDWDNDFELLSTEELKMEVARLKKANQVLRQKVDEESKIQSGWAVVLSSVMKHCIIFSAKML